MPNIKAGANRYKTKGKLQILIPLRDALAFTRKGLNPIQIQI
jgi:hypothetical protein